MNIGITNLQGLISAIWDRLATATRRSVFGTEVTDGFEPNSGRSSHSLSNDCKCDIADVSRIDFQCLIFNHFSYSA
jgi:hypothetical protein